MTFHRFPYSDNEIKSLIPKILENIFANTKAGLVVSISRAFSFKNLTIAHRAFLSSELPSNILIAMIVIDMICPL